MPRFDDLQLTLADVIGDSREPDYDLDDLYDPYEWDDYGWDWDYDPEPEDDYDLHDFEDEEYDEEPLPEPDEPHEIVLPLIQSVNLAWAGNNRRYYTKRYKSACRRVDNSKPKRKDHRA